MGTGASTRNIIPDLDDFKVIAAEYDKLKTVGLSAEEMHLILQKRVASSNESKVSGVVDDAEHIPSKDDGAPRLAEQAGHNNPAPANSAVQSYVGNVSNNRIEEDDIQNGLILLIDDSAVATKVASKVLTSLNFEVVTANTAKMGYDILVARQEDVLLIFLDVVMPQVDGVECLSWMKENPDVAHIPVYMLSGLEDQLLAEVCQERGAEGMLLKPLNQGIVTNILQNHNIKFNPPSETRKSDHPDGSVTRGSRATQESRVVNYGGGTGDGTGMDGRRSGPQGGSSPQPEPDVLIQHRQQDERISPQTPSLSSNRRVGGNSSTTSDPWEGTTGGIATSAISAVSAARGSASITHVSNAGTRPMLHNALTERSQAPAFKLVDSDLQVFTFPSPATAAAGNKGKRGSRSRTYLVFIPSLYCSDLYEDEGFLSQLFDIFDDLTANNEQVVCISADLPFALKAAKERFKLPFTLLSDPSLFISQRFVGTVDIGRILAKPLEDEATSDFSHHIQNSFIGPQLGVLMVNKNREVLKKWTSCDVEAPGADPVLNSFPKDILNWSAQFPDNDDASTKPKAKKTITRQEKPETTSRNVAGVSNGAAAAAAATTNDEQQSRVHILIVDDSSVSSRVASKKLEGRGYEVSVAYNGQQAYDMLKRAPRGKFSVVLTDVVMPVCDGMELLRMLKADEDLLSLPVFMLSGLEGDTLSKNCLQAGAAALLKKPFDDAAFHAMLQQLL